MGISPHQVQVVSEIADLIYDFLPGTPYRYADQNLSFPGCAHKLGLSHFWMGGSKRPAISSLLRYTLDTERGKFCQLMVEIVMSGIIYRKNKKNPISREEIDKLNKLIIGVGFKIPDLWDKSFLNSLTSHQSISNVKSSTDTALLQNLRQEYIDLVRLDPQKRGYAFQDFLIRMFSAYGLNPKTAFRLVGEEIDGSFELNGDTYLLEAKWQSAQTNERDLAIFSTKVAGKSIWSRGLFISYAGYNKTGLEAFARGKQTNIIGMDGQDLFFILDGKISLKDAIQIKARRAAETNDFFISVFQIIN